MAKKHSAQCACGAIKFEFDADPSFIADCYCKDCQKSSGGAMATFFGVPEDDFTLISGTPKSFHYNPARRSTGTSARIAELASSHPIWRAFPARSSSRSTA